MDLQYIFPPILLLQILIAVNVSSSEQVSYGDGISFGKNANLWLEPHFIIKPGGKDYIKFINSKTDKETSYKPIIGTRDCSGCQSYHDDTLEEYDSLKVSNFGAGADGGTGPLSGRYKELKGAVGLVRIPGTDKEGSAFIFVGSHPDFDRAGVAGHMFWDFYCNPIEYLEYYPEPFVNKSSPEARIYPFRLGSETCPWVGNGKEKIKEDYVMGEDWAVGIVDKRLNLKVRFSWVTGTDEEFKEIFFDHNYELFSLGYNPETGRIEQANWTYVVEKNNKGELFKRRTRCTGFPIGSNRNRPRYMIGALPTNCPLINGGSGSVLGLYHKRTGKFLAIGNQIAQTNLRDKSGNIVDNAPFFGPRINPNFAVLIRDEYDLAIKDAGKFDSINEFFQRVP